MHYMFKFFFYIDCFEIKENFVLALLQLQYFVYRTLNAILHFSIEKYDSNMIFM